MYLLESQNICAIVVTYNPDYKILDKLVKSLLLQVARIIIVDNGSNQDVLAWYHDYQSLENIEILKIVTNIGIAAGQNKGIKLARDNKARYVLLMDQDSIPECDMVEKLLSALVELPDVAAVGPRYVLDRATQLSPFVRTTGLHRERLRCDTGVDVLQVDYLISSGCLIPIAVLDIVGGMREDFFIDYVDVEWGLRANQHRLYSYGVCSAVMRHSLGDAPQVVLGKSIGTHSPLRHYYYVRNAIILYRESWIPINWKLSDGWRLCLRAMVYMVFSKPHLANIRMILLAIFHGLTRRSGKFLES
jgi:rhamnosyltransferase